MVWALLADAQDGLHLGGAHAACGIDCTPDTYTQEAGKLTTLLADILNDTAQLAAFTHNATLESVQSEVEVSVEGDPRELVAKAVVDCVDEGTIPADEADDEFHILFETSSLAVSCLAWFQRRKDSTN